MSSSEEIQSETTVLLIEDNPGDARLIEEMIQMKGNLLDDTQTLSPNIELLHEECLEDGQAVLEASDIDIVLLDLMLPDSGGEETLDAVLEQTDSVPVVLLTGLNDREFGVEAVQRGAQDFLVKGEIDGDLLVRTMRYAIERKKNERALERRTKQLGVLTQILEHDVRNDVNVVCGNGELLSEVVDDEHVEYVERILENGEHVVEITETVSTLLETIIGENELTVEPTNLERVLDAEIRKARASYEHARFEVVGDIPSAWVAADNMLSSVFSNLLNNAVQHADSADPHVEISVEARDKRVIVSIADDGPGVPADQQSAVFGRGEQGLESTGSGVGLFLVDELVDQYGGSVDVSDNDPRGAVFEVELRATEAT